MLTYRESIAVDRILIQQIVNAIEDKFLKALCDQTTNRIIMKISEILIYLFDTYGDIPPQEMESLREKIEKMTFDPTKLVNEIFTKIDNYTEVANIVNDQILSSQQCKLAYLVLLNTKKFQSGLKEWDKRERQLQTWMISKYIFDRSRYNSGGQEI